MEKKNEKVLEARKAICPIIFVKDAPIKSEGVNNLFFVPYDIACVANGSAIAETIEAEKNIPEPVFNDFTKSFSNIVFDIEADAIKHYLSMNIYDAINSFFINFISKNIIHLEPSISHDSDEYEVGIEGNFMYPNFDFKSLNLSELINNIATTEYYKLSSIYYSQIATRIFMKIVESYSNTIAASTCCVFGYTYKNFAYPKRVFKALCKKVYDDENAIDANYISNDYMYTFIASIIREDFEKESHNLYNTLLMIVENAAKMADKSIINPVSVNACIDDIMSENMAKMSAPKQHARSFVKKFEEE